MRATSPHHTLRLQRASRFGRDHADNALRGYSRGNLRSMADMGAGNAVTGTLWRCSPRRVFDGFRALDRLIRALAHARAVGLGPLPGVPAISTGDIAGARQAPCRGDRECREETGRGRGRDGRAL